MSENSESKVLYVSDTGHPDSYNSEYNNNNDYHDGGMTDEFNETNNEEYDGGMTDEQSNQTESQDGGMTNEIVKSEIEEFDENISYGGGNDSDNESIDTCEILKVDPLMIRLNCFLKSQNGETIVEILKDIRDELVTLNKNMTSYKPKPVPTDQ